MVRFHPCALRLTSFAQCRHHFARFSELRGAQHKKRKSHPEAFGFEWEGKLGRRFFTLPPIVILPDWGNSSCLPVADFLQCGGHGRGRFAKDTGLVGRFRPNNTTAEANETHVSIGHVLFLT